MRTPVQADHDLVRILLYRKDSAELLVKAGRSGFRLPCMAVRRHRRMAEEITAALEDKWNLQTYCLFPLPNRGSVESHLRYYIVETCLDNATARAGTEWLPVPSLSAGALEDGNEYEAIETSLETLDQYRRGQLPGRFGKPGWLREVREWVEAQVSAHKIRLTGKFRQLNASPTFSLLRFETNGPALWFKAVGEPNIREFSTTRTLARIAPHFVPRVIAWHPDWNAWLSVEAEGVHLSDTAPLSARQQAAGKLADLQITSFGHGLHLIDAGCRDIRPRSLLPLVNPFFESMAELMELQTKPEPPRLSGAELLSLADEVRCCFGELSAGELPNTLGHLDLNPGNILLSTDRCVFLDWAEGSVGHPFFTFQYLLEHWRRFRSREFEPEKTLVSSYFSGWRAFASPDEIAKHLGLMPVLAAFAYAANLSLRNSEGCRSPVLAGLLRSLTRRMKREADDWAAGEHHRRALHSVTSAVEVV